MDVTRFVARPPPGQDYRDAVTHAGQVPGVRVVDAELPNAVLIEVPNDLVSEVTESLEGWKLSREVEYPLPGPPRPVPKPEPPE